MDTKIEVYYPGTDQKITEFSVLIGEGYYKVLLTELIGTYDTFDLKIVNLDDNNFAYLEFDHIIDPTGLSRPTSFTDVSIIGTNEPNAYDGNTGSQASFDIDANANPAYVNYSGFNIPT